MHDFVRNLITEWRRLEMPTSDATVVVGVSGGADSVSLLLAMHELRELKKLNLRLVAAHFNHRLRDGESDADEQFIREFTIERKIEFASGHAEPLEASNLEQKARVARYAFLSRTAENVGAFAVLTGHTVNDQAETFLINLLRGSGPTGLCGMKAVRPIADRPPPQTDGCEPDADTEEPLLFAEKLLLVRPLVTWAKRLHTEGYCHDRQIEYRYDTMNEDTAFKRVRIRKILLPLLEDFNPNIVETLARTASLMQQIPENLIAEGPEDELRIVELRAMPSDELYEKLRSWLGRKRGDKRSLSLKHIQAIERLVKSEKSGRVAELPGKAAVVRSDGRLTYRENSVD
ncbi:MAG TPA: tRNA lysidine(34) synthetase TilS [Pyrinomonadaceae bacterium]|nr:tRNA lysidine(34) synthetase TilS [Pyrinomonadaceae bacterium]